MASTFLPVLAFAFVLALMFIGAVLRQRFKVLQKNLVPASLIGGVIGFFLFQAVLASLPIGRFHADCFSRLYAELHVTRAHESR